jgi:hypothetical protein
MRKSEFYRLSLELAQLAPAVFKDRLQASKRETE